MCCSVAKTVTEQTLYHSNDTICGLDETPDNERSLGNKVQVVLFLFRTATRETCLSRRLGL